MTDSLASLYPWIKSLHIIAFVAWMAGLFYLPRLFVYHVEQAQVGTDKAQMLETMERKLLKVIMNPAMIVTWICGLLMIGTPGLIDWTAAWPYAKAAAVIAMTWFHMWCGKQRKQLAAGDFSVPGRSYRLMNEVPTLLLIVIVVSVVARPF
ncbi:protoporphyrinogen oxidase HemJ [Maribius pontilimi]|uniref:Protoporphyrinogen IX oxidase n=1 Tax=Palleronia pontilimi TaxID=1964209 RepID=A0A934I6V5_9RHOB|nr:protoporphyrinogen oxidase HemJ [Palleronia pontilimi]MBJ3761544.1 protoporphyrinogen oxidase HemJ [Palleronia pontilimi]